METNFKKKRWESPKYRDAANGQNCTIRLPGCRNDTETVCLAHANGAGVAMKADDHNAADMCAYCHDIFDGRNYHGIMLTRDTINNAFRRARLETIINRIERGILRCK